MDLSQNIAENIQEAGQETNAAQGNLMSFRSWWQDQPDDLRAEFPMEKAYVIWKAVMSSLPKMDVPCAGSGDQDTHSEVRRLTRELETTQQLAALQSKWVQETAKYLGRKSGVTLTHEQVVGLIQFIALDPTGNHHCEDPDYCLELFESFLGRNKVSVEYLKNRDIVQVLRAAMIYAAFRKEFHADDSENIDVDVVLKDFLASDEYANAVEDAASDKGA